MHRLFWQLVFRQPSFLNFKFNFSFFEQLIFKRRTLVISGCDILSVKEVTDLGNAVLLETCTHAPHTVEGTLETYLGNAKHTVLDTNCGYFSCIDGSPYLLLKLTCCSC